jgi:phage shock protein PspC (stress-responsive transcriptional regulator)
MNEITRIHLGRQPFVIAVDAHKQLRTYLEAIKEEVGASHQEVLEEVELRMAELLAERGIEGEKAILATDVAYLKEQLGTPKDFKTDNDADTAAGKPEAEESATENSQVPKRLYRDTQNGVVSGVSAGLAAFFGVDAVIVRLIFIVLTLLWGWGIALYIILWIVVPEAKTASERLNMRGKAVTVDSLKELVDRADVQGAAKRAGKHVGPFIEKLFRIFAAIIGVILCIAAGFALFGIAVATTFLISHHGDLIQGVMAFPVGVRESVAVISGLVVAGVLAVLLMLLGTSMANAVSAKKWTVPGWVVGSLIGVALLAAAAGASVMPDVVHSVRDRYEAAYRTTTRDVDVFTSMKVRGDMAFTLVESADYKLDVKYLGNADTKDIKTSIKDGVLTLDVSNFNKQLDCDNVCIGVGDMPEVTIYAPQLQSVDLNGNSTASNILPGDRYITQDYNN